MAHIEVGGREGIYFTKWYSAEMRIQNYNLILKLPSLKKEVAFNV